jgi:hypothetical protein
VRLQPACCALAASLSLCLLSVFSINHKHFRIWIFARGIHRGDVQARVAKVKAEEAQANLQQVILDARFLPRAFPRCLLSLVCGTGAETFCAQCFSVSFFPWPWPSTGDRAKGVCGLCGLRVGSRMPLVRLVRLVRLLSLVAVVAVCGLVQCLKEVDLETLAPVGFTMQVLRKREG